MTRLGTLLTFIALTGCQRSLEGSTSITDPAFAKCPMAGSPNGGVVWIESPHPLAVPHPPGQRPEVGAGFGVITVDRCPCYAGASAYAHNPDMTSPPDGFGRADNAGTITIQNSAIEMLVPDSDGLYPGVSPGVLFIPGDHIAISAGGGKVPAFQTSIDGPYPVTIISPPSGAAIPHKLGDALLVTWQGGQTGEAVMVDVIVHRFEDTWEVRCLFNAEAGMGWVPSDLFDKLSQPTEVRQSTAQVAAGSANIQTIKPGNWMVEIRAATPALAKGGGEWSAVISPP